MNLEIKIFDVELGCSVLIKTPNGNIFFQDLGVTNNNDFKPSKFLVENSMELDGVIITHPHRDHIDDIIEIDKLRSFMLINNNIPDRLIENQIESADNDYDKTKFKKFLEIKSRDKVNVRNTPFYQETNGGVKFNIFYPIEHAEADLNYYSLTTLVTYGDFKVLLMGDNTKGNINELLNNDKFIEYTKNIDVLLAPHHGRESSYVEDLMNHLNPKLTIISDKSNVADISAVDKYSAKSKGVFVINNVNKEFRKCLTTRNDGTISLEFSKENQSMEIYID